MYVRHDAGLPDTGESLIPVLRAKNIARSVAWWERLGFSVERGWEGQPPGNSGGAWMVRGSLRVHLYEGKDTPTGMVQLALEDAEEVAAALGNPFVEDNVTEVVDPAGNRVQIVYA